MNDTMKAVKPSIISIIIFFELIIVVGGWKFKPNLNPNSIDLNFMSEKTNTQNHQIFSKTKSNNNTSMISSYR